LAQIEFDAIEAGSFDLHEDFACSRHGGGDIVVLELVGVAIGM
jgi:hypothetical protein